jgi:hypothetical protein
MVVGGGNIKCLSKTSKMMDHVSTFSCGAMHGLTIKGNRKSFSSLLALWGKLLVENLDLIIHSK